MSSHHAHHGSLPVTNPCLHLFCASLQNLFDETQLDTDGVMPTALKTELQCESRPGDDYHLYLFRLMEEATNAIF